MSPGSGTGTQAIIECDSLTVEDFNRNNLQGGQPIVIRGYAKSWPAFGWTLAQLKDKVGENTVHVRRKTDSDDYKVGKRYNIETMAFCEYIKNIERNNKKSKSSYLAVQNIKQTFPQLEPDVRVPPFVGKVHGGPFLWVAPEKHYEFCHFDPDDNILIVLAGQKRVKLFGCSIDPMYPNPLGSKGRTIQSQVYCQEPDLTTHPSFVDAPCYECVLEAGDLLYFPAFWWHQVTSEKMSISMNIFFGDAGENVYLEKIMNSEQWPAFRYWLLNIIEQNKSTESFKRVLQHLRSSLSNFILKQWHEEPSDKQLDVLVNTVMEFCKIETLPQPTEDLRHPPPLKIRGLLWRS